MKKGLFLLFCLFGAFQLFGSASASASSSSSSSSSYADCRSGRGLTADDKALFRAVRRGTIEKVKAALEAVIDLRCKNNRGNTPLRIAIGNRNVVAVEELLQSGKNVSEDDKDNLLDYVCNEINKLENEDSVSNLKESGEQKLSAFKKIERLFVNDNKGGNGKSRFRSSNTPEADPLTRYASAGASSYSYADCRSGENLTDGDKALFRAIQKGGSKGVETALEAVIDLRCKNSSSTPLRAAIGKRWFGAVEILLGSGKYVSEGDKSDLLDFVHDKVDELKRRNVSSKSIKIYEKIEQLLVNDSRFCYSNTPEADRLTASASSSYTDCRSRGSLTDGDKNLFRAIQRGGKKDVETALEAVTDLRCKNNSSSTPLRAAIGKGRAIFVRIMLESGEDVSEDDKDSLLDYIHNEINMLENKHRAGNLTEWIKNKLSAFKKIEQLLVDDNKGEGRASRFRYTRTPDSEWLTRSASASVTASASSSSSSSSSSSVPAAATAAAVVEVSSSSSSSATSAGRATSKRKEPEVDPAADKDGAVTGGAQKKRKPSAAAVVDVIAVVPAAEAAVDEENTGEAAAVDSGVEDRDNGMRLTPAEFDGLVDSGASANVVYYPLLSDEEYNLFGSDDEGGFLMDEDSW